MSLARVWYVVVPGEVGDPIREGGFWRTFDDREVAERRAKNLAIENAAPYRVVRVEEHAYYPPGRRATMSGSRTSGTEDA